MSFTFVHTGDWHIGRRFGGFPTDVAAALREARLSAIDRVADAARGGRARHVLVAGDVFDGEALPARTVAQALARMAAQAGVVWHLIPGNHDPHRPGGLWERTVRAGLPANVVAHLMPEPVPLEAGVVLLPAPLTGKSAGRDPSHVLDAMPSPPGALRIGLAHGPVQGFGSEGASVVTVAKSTRGVGASSIIWRWATGMGRNRSRTALGMPARPSPMAMPTTDRAAH